MTCFASLCYVLTHVLCYAILFCAILRHALLSFVGLCSMVVLFHVVFVYVDVCIRMSIYIYVYIYIYMYICMCIYIYTYIYIYMYMYIDIHGSVFRL